MHEVRRYSHQDGPLPCRSPETPDVKPLEVTQPSVDYLEAVSGGPGCKVVFLHQCYREAAHRCFPGDRCTIDPTANDEHVEFTRRQPSHISPHDCKGPLRDMCAWRGVDTRRSCNQSRCSLSVLT